MPKYTNKKKVTAERRISLSKRMRHIRHVLFEGKSLSEKERIIEDSENRSISKCVEIPGTSHQLHVCMDNGNVNNNILTSQSLSFANTFSRLSVDTCETTHEAEKIIDNFNDDSVKSVSDIRKFCENAILSHEIHTHMNDENTIDNDAMKTQSLLNTFPENPVHVYRTTENPVDACQIDSYMVESENTMQSNMDDTEDIENTALHVDENIDAGRLSFAEISGRCIVDFRHVFAELQRLSTHWIGECRFTDLVIIKTKRHGLKTQYFVGCQMCHFTNSFWSEPTDDKILDVNRGAVCGTILTGTGHKREGPVSARCDSAPTR